MATLERPRDTHSTTTASSTAAPSSFEPSAVPSPFPDEVTRGRPGAPGQQLHDSHTSSQSPGGTRRSLSRVVDKVRRAISTSRDPTSSSQERGRRASADTTATEEPRGRSPLTAAFSPRSVSRSRTRNPNAIPEEGEHHYPLGKQQTRSSSRGRSVHTAAPHAKVFSTGRGGAGNLIGVGENEDPMDYDGEEDPSVVNQVRTDRSRSRERLGRDDVVTSGRGGRGNIRSHSRTRDLELGRVPTVLEEQEKFDREDEEARAREILRKAERDGPERWVSSGRGGAGNFFSPRRQSSGNGQ
ncbi:hypothetical protein JCM8097_008925 [Rhodosporidiobolus ruineniae]